MNFSRRSILSRALLCLTLLAFLGAETKPAATTQPTTDESTRAKEVFITLVQQGTNALAAGEYPAALESLLDAKQIFDRKMRAKTSTVGSPEHVAMLHGLALTYQLIQKPEKASPLFENNSPLDRACSTKNASRQLLVTRAALDATQGYLAMRSVVSLTNYLKEHPDELDSELLDLLFTSLQKADERVTNRALTLEPAMKLYEDFNGRLEATRPGQKRWGVQWISMAQFNLEMGKRRQAIKVYEQALDRLDEAQAAVKDAEIAYENSKKNGVYTKARVQAASDRLARARDIAYQKQKTADDARAAIPLVPALTKDDFKRILTPHDVDVLVSKQQKNTTVAAAGTDTSRSVKFSLGPTTTPPKTNVPTVTQPPSVFEPPPITRRTFSRSATGFAVAPGLFLTSADAVKGSTRVAIEIPAAVPTDATVERTGTEGLALLRVKNQRLPYLNLATAFAGGPVHCPAFPEVSVFGVSLENIAGRALAPQDDGWKVSLLKHPRLPGAPLLNDAGEVVGIEMGDRDDPYDRLPALSFKKIKEYLAQDAPAQPCGSPRSAAVVQITAYFEK
jgi:tetratricopeptide (TPR) repeat protein